MGTETHPDTAAAEFQYVEHGARHLWRYAGDPDDPTVEALICFNREDRSQKQQATDSRCALCWLSFPHTEQEHDRRLGKGPRSPA